MNKSLAVVVKKPITLKADNRYSMYSLNRDQHEALFKHSIGIADERQANKAETLLANSEAAAEIHSKLKATLAPLDSIRDHRCPDDLAEGTVLRLRKMANAEQAEREPVVLNSRSWHNFIQVGAIAATVLIAVGVLIPSLSFARHQYRKHVCQNQLADIGSCIGSYCSDHDGKLPAVTNDVEQPWCNAGDQSGENRSNNSNLYLLMKLGYSTRPQDFVCCNRYESRLNALKISQISAYSDFPKGHITDSFRIFCRQSVKISQLAGQPLMADRNPVFEKLSEDRFKVQLDDELCSRNSMNHNRQGQNVLFTDGHSVFLKTRHVGIPQDDIFTVQNVVEYQGTERPVCEKDPFLAP